MIAANKRLLKATLTEGVLSIQSNLISLYTDNLAAMGVQAALIGGFAFAACQSDYEGYVLFTLFLIILFKIYIIK